MILRGQPATFIPENAGDPEVAQWFSEKAPYESCHNLTSGPLLLPTYQPQTALTSSSFARAALPGPSSLLQAVLAADMGSLESCLGFSRPCQVPVFSVSTFAFFGGFWTAPPRNGPCTGTKSLRGYSLHLQEQGHRRRPTVAEAPSAGRDFRSPLMGCVSRDLGEEAPKTPPGIERARLTVTQRRLYERLP